MFKLFSYWKSEQNQKNPIFFKAFWKTFGPSLSLPLILFCLEVSIIIQSFVFFNLNQFSKDCVIKTGQPLLLAIIIRYFSDSNESSSFNMFLVAGAYSLSTLLAVSLQHPSYAACNRISMRAKIAWNAIIYKKVRENKTNYTFNKTNDHF